MRIVGIHGVANDRPGESVEQAAANLAQAWRNALNRGPYAGGLSDLEIDVTYYADLLRRPGRQGDEANLDDLPPDAEEMIRAWLGQLDLPAGVPQGPGTYPIRQALAWVAARRHVSPKIVEWFIGTFFAEVTRYLRDDQRDGSAQARRAARERVAERIAARRPQVVIAHSLGSVVTYEALWARPSLEVDLLITVGSPLALPHVVFPRLSPAATGGLGHRPPGVRRWVNLADPGDLIAIPVRGVSRYFSGVAVDRHDVIGAFDFHRAANYLASDGLAEVLAAEPR
jgi:hypothetical protein